MNSRLSLALVAALAAVPSAARAEWLTQSFALRAGWNAVFLHVDASHATLDQLVGTAAPTLTPIDQVWRWNPDPVSGQFIQSPQEPATSGTQWNSWKRTDEAGSTLQRLTANSAYLVYSTSDYTLTLKGRPTLPLYQWSTSGLNFFGFPTTPNNPPSFESFLTEVPSLQVGEIFGYNGGEFGPANPTQIFARRTTPVVRGQAFWIRAGEVYNHYYGPFEISGLNRGDIAFGDSSSSVSFRLRNLTSAPLTVSLNLLASETPPAGQPPIANIPQLLLRGAVNPSTLTHSFTQLPVGAAASWNLPPKGQPGSDVEVVLGLDRAAITENVGERLAGILRFTDSLAHNQVDIAVSAEVHSHAGLWVGGAAVVGVGQYLKAYARNETDNTPTLDASGAYVVTNLDTRLTPTASPFPLRLIVLNPETGPARLFQRLYHGYDAVSNRILTATEAPLNRTLIAESRRISAAHLPWSDNNTHWTFNGHLSQSASISTSITNRFNSHASNPFLHTYHPDHDNLDPRFRQEVPQGSESYTIIRDITLTVYPPANHFASRVTAGLTLTGDYLETIRVVGLARPGNSFDTRTFEARGAFSLNRISEIATLTQAP